MQQGPMCKVRSQIMSSDKQLWVVCFHKCFPGIISEVAGGGKAAVFRVYIFGFLASPTRCPEEHSDGAGAAERGFPPGRGGAGGWHLCVQGCRCRALCCSPPAASLVLWALRASSELFVLSTGTRCVAPVSGLASEQLLLEGILQANAPFQHCFFYSHFDFYVILIFCSLQQVNFHCFSALAWEKRNEC